MSRSDLKEKLDTTTAKAKETAAAAVDMAAEAGRSAKAEISAQASETMKTVRDAASERADDAREAIVGVGDRLAETLHDQAGHSEGMSSRVLGGLADGLSHATDGLRGRSFGDLLSDAQGYARRHPGAFAVGAAVAGFALARFLRSSDRAHTAAERAAESTDRVYRDAARRTVDTLGMRREDGPKA